MKHKKIFWLWSVFSAAAAVCLCSAASFDFLPSPSRDEKIVLPDNNCAADERDSEEKKANESGFLQWQFLPSEKSYVTGHDKEINGVALGYYLPQRKVNGVSVALIQAYNVEKSGFSMSLLEYSGISNGFNLFFAGGMQSNRGVSLGVLNMTESNQGFQIGLINQEERNLLVEYDMKPEMDRKKFGVQAGVINYSDAPGIQFGLWNTNPNSLIKHFPIFNICF